ncbi:hypothetical protein PCCS19_50720 [Paenibacillus sp. CCS19]|nr:hypothetical protein PCCS19_50720 [Paenibacillus cellulosilyticus]
MSILRGALHFKTVGFSFFFVLSIVRRAAKPDISGGAVGLQEIIRLIAFGIDSD